MTKTVEQLNKEIREANKILGDGKKGTGLRGEYEALQAKIAKLEAEIKKLRSEYYSKSQSSSVLAEEKLRAIEQKQAEIKNIEKERENVGAKIYKTKAPMREAEKQLSVKKAKLFELKRDLYAKPVMERTSIEAQIAEVQKEIKLLQGHAVNRTTSQNSTKNDGLVPAKTKEQIETELAEAKKICEEARKKHAELQAKLENMEKNFKMYDEKGTPTFQIAAQLEAARVDLFAKENYLTQLTTKRDSMTATPVIQDAKKGKTPVRLPEDVMKKAKELEAKVSTLSDSKGNKIYIFRKDKQDIGVMTQKKGEKLSEFMDVKSEDMKKLVQKARDAAKSKSELTGVIEEINKQNSDDKFKESIKFVAPSVEDSLAAELKQEPEKKPELPKQQEPTIRLVPKKRRNGEDSKRRFEGIELTDVDGNKFMLTKKMVKEAIKNDGISVTAGEKASYAWDNYVEAAKNGTLKAETVASFFKGKANMVTEAQKAEQQAAALRDTEIMHWKNAISR